MSEREFAERVAWLEKAIADPAGFALNDAYQGVNMLPALLACIREQQADMQWFVARVDAGEVLSKKTYARFKATLAKWPLP